MEQQSQPTPQTEKKYVSKLLVRKDIDEKDELDLVTAFLLPILIISVGLLRSRKFKS